MQLGFKLNKAAANKQSIGTTRQKWEKIARQIGISRTEQELMAKAFTSRIAV